MTMHRMLFLFAVLSSLSMSFVEVVEGGHQRFVHESNGRARRQHRPQRRVSQVTKLHGGGQHNRQWRRHILLD